MEFADVQNDLAEVLLTEEDIHGKIAEMARTIEADYAGEKLLLVGVLRGAVMVMADLARELKLPGVRVERRDGLLVFSAARA